MKIEKRNNIAILTAEEGQSLVCGGQLPEEPVSKATCSIALLEQWSEVSIEQVTAASAQKQRDEAYRQRVETLIAERYTLSEEVAIQRQRDTKPEEFAAYNDFAEACKARARAELNLETNLSDSEEAQEE